MDDPFRQVDKAEGFEWNAGNQDKNWIKHGVTRDSCEQVFFHEPLLLARDNSHSAAETRWFALGVDQTGQRMFVSFTIRKRKIRVISARPMSRQERRYYEAGKKENS